MPKNVKPDEIGRDDCLTGGPNGHCQQHGYPFYACAAIVARMREANAALLAERDRLEEELAQERKRTAWHWGAIAQKQGERAKAAEQQRDRLVEGLRNHPCSVRVNGFCVSAWCARHKMYHCADLCALLPAEPPAHGEEGVESTTRPQQNPVAAHPYDYLSTT